MSPLEIYSIINKFVKFINKDVDVKPSQYTISRLKVIPFKEISNNEQRFERYFVDEIKDLSTKKV